MFLYNMLADGKSQSAAAGEFISALLCPVKAFKNTVLFICGDTNSRIGNGHDHFSVFRRQFHHYMAAFMIIFHRIIQKIHRQLG